MLLVGLFKLLGFFLRFGQHALVVSHRPDSSHEVFLVQPKPIEIAKRVFRQVASLHESLAVPLGDQSSCGCLFGTLVLLLPASLDFIRDERGSRYAL
jgi:hypothetical protein